MAVAVAAVLTGTSLPVEPYANLAAIAARLDLSMISHGPARFDPAELAGLNARLLHTMPYDAARPRLEAMGLADEDLWYALRQNLDFFDDVKELAELVRGPVAPVIAEEDRDFIDLAHGLLPPEPWDEHTFDLWTTALKEMSGRKGRALYKPLRLALTGREDGPELRSLLPLLGRRVCLDRLS
jgi:glutamyl-tRNA synthetase